MIVVIMICKLCSAGNVVSMKQYIEIVLGGVLGMRSKNNKKRILVSPFQFLLQWQVIQG